MVRALARDAHAAEGDATVSRAESAAIYEPDAATVARAAAEVRERIAGTPAATLDDFYVSAALMARKGSVPRAAALLANFAAWRARVGDANPHSCAKMAEQLRTGAFVSPGTRDKEGRAVVYLRLRLLDPNRYSPLDTVRLAAFAYDWTIRTYPWAQSHGVALMQVRLRPQRCPCVSVESGALTLARLFRAPARAPTGRGRGEAEPS
jgi:hypothetical protein